MHDVIMFPAVSKEDYIDYDLVAWHFYRDKACDSLKILSLQIDLYKHTTSGVTRQLSGIMLSSKIGHLTMINVIQPCELERETT